MAAWCCPAYARRPPFSAADVMEHVRRVNPAWVNMGWVQAYMAMTLYSYEWPTAEVRVRDRCRCRSAVVTTDSSTSSIRLADPNCTVAKSSMLKSATTMSAAATSTSASAHTEMCFRSLPNSESGSTHGNGTAACNASACAARCIRARRGSVAALDFQATTNVWPSGATATRCAALGRLR